MPTPSTTAHFHFRRFIAEDDLLRLALLLAEVEAVDSSGEDISEALLREQLIWPGHAPSQDRWIVEAPDDQNKLIAFSSIWKSPLAEHGDIYGVVHPSWRRHGIGSELLMRTLTRARELNAFYIFANVDVLNKAANDFMRKYNFHPLSTYVEMRISSDVPLRTPAWPAGYQVRTYDTVLDFPTLVRALNRSYQGLWGHREWTEEELKDLLSNMPLHGMFLVFAPDGDVVGTCRAEISEHLSARRGKRTGYVDSPGIVPEHRKDGLYLPLLLTVLQWIRSQEPVDIELESWGDSEQTLELFRSVGFKTLRQQTMYRQELSALY